MRVADSPQYKAFIARCARLEAPRVKACRGCGQSYPIDVYRASRKHYVRCPGCRAQERARIDNFRRRRSTWDQLPPAAPGERRCTSCWDTKPLASFWKRGAGRDHHCVVCRNAASAEKRKRKAESRTEVPRACRLCGVSKALNEYPRCGNVGRGPTCSACVEGQKAETRAGREAEISACRLASAEAREAKRLSREEAKLEKIREAKLRTTRPCKGCGVEMLREEPARCRPCRLAYWREWRAEKMATDPAFAKRAREKLAALSKTRKLGPKGREARRRRRRRQELKKSEATPKCLQPKIFKGILAYDEEQRRRTRETGEQHHVDHMIPRSGDEVFSHGERVQVSGLNVPWNLCVMPRSDNEKKSNELVEGMAAVLFEEELSLLNDPKHRAEGCPWCNGTAVRTNY